MYIQEVSITIANRSNREELFETFQLFVSRYRGSGQKQGELESTFIQGKQMVALPYTLEKDSLHKKYNNHYVNRDREKLETLCGAPLKIRTVGKTSPDYKGPCSCKEPAFYILITNYISITSPVNCGSCGLPVPLYRFPVYNDHGYMDILRWESNYIACDTLQMDSEVGEKWGLNQMENPKSQLSRQGRKICSKLEKLVSKPVYYYLHNYSRYSGDNLNRTCPECQRKWGLKKRLHNLYDFKCDHCRLLSVISPNA